MIEAMTDFIFHGYGGGSGSGKDKTPPPPCTNFTAISGNAIVTLNWTNPTDTDFVGIKILRKEGTYPTSPTDGTIVYSGANTSYVDNTVVNSTTYKYRAFTFDYDNNFNTTESGQEAIATPLADTTPPNPVTNFIATGGNAQVAFSWTNPTDLDFMGVKLLRKEGSYPTDATDGTIVYNGTNTSVIDTSVINGITYYYKILPYDTSYNYNTTSVGQEVVVTPNSVREYGINWNKSTDVITRLGSAIGLNAPTINGNTNYTNDFSSIYPWNSMKRTNLSDTGVENAIYGDVTYKTDGTNGQCMVRVPKFYYKVVNVDADNIQFWIADAPKSGYEVHPAFFRCRDKACDNQTGVVTEVDKRYHHTYLPISNGPVLKSESKSDVTPSTNGSLTNARIYAKNRGNGWGLVDFNLRYAIQLLYLVEFASFDSQTKIGKGFTDSTNTAYHVTGGTNSYGNSSYGETTGKLQMSYRGIEDFYGNSHQWIDGFFCNASRNVMIGNKGFNNFGTGYTTYTTGLGADISGYISDIFNDKTTGFVPKLCSGSATTKLYDVSSLYANTCPTGGGYYANASIGGIFQFECNRDGSYGYAGIALSLAY